MGKKNKPILQRSRHNRIIAGVCGGLGEYTGINPHWFRLIFILLSICGNIFGGLLYGLFWVIMPGEQWINPLIQNLFRPKKNHE